MARQARIEKMQQRDVVLFFFFSSVSWATPCARLRLVLDLETGDQRVVLPGRDNPDLVTGAQWVVLPGRERADLLTGVLRVVFLVEVAVRAERELSRLAGGHTRLGTLELLLERSPLGT